MSIPINRPAMVADYRNEYNLIQISRPAGVEAAARKILSLKSRYQAVEKLTGVPWFFIGVLHMRENSNNFDGCLANGDKCIGNNRKTYNEPRGRGPWPTWEASAVWALQYDGLTKVTDWSDPGVWCFEAEKFNGEGYHAIRKPSPYVWAGTQWYSRGKYVRDGVYDPSEIDVQIGCAAVIHRVRELDKGWAPPVVLKPHNDTGKLHPAEKKVVIAHSRFLRWGEWYANFCTYVGLSSGAIATAIPTFASFLTDWRTLTVAGVLGGGLGLYYISKFNLLNAAAQGRYMPSGLGGIFNIPQNVGQPAMADGPNLSAPPSPETEPLAPDSPSVAMVASPPTDPALVQGLGMPAVQIEEAA